MISSSILPKQHNGVWLQNWTSSYDDADDLVFAVAVNQNIPAPGATDAISFTGSSGKPHPQPENPIPLLMVSV